jgi:hypothetical protein
LLDTPGFSDTYRSDREVLNDLATWLMLAFKCKIQLSGIVYLHAITHTRMEGPALRNLNTFKKMCGADNLSCVVLATTFWSDVSSQVGDRREAELKDKPKFWGDMRAQGCTVLRHTNDRDSARNILSCILDKRTKTYLAIQNQMGAQKKGLDETDAGIELGGELFKQKREWEQRLRRAEEGTKVALQEQDQEHAQELLEMQAKCKSEIEKRERDEKAMKVNMEEMLKNKERRFEEEIKSVMASREQELKRQERQHDDEIRRVRNQAASEASELTDRLNMQRQYYDRQLSGNDTLQQQYMADMQSMNMYNAQIGAWAGVYSSLVGSALSQVCTIM